MNKQNLLTIWAKRAIPALALAAVAVLTLPSCEKEIEQHDVIIPYYKDNNNNLEIRDEKIQAYAADKQVRNIFITVMPEEIFTDWWSGYISKARSRLSETMSLSPKIRGRGNFEFKPGECMPGDSLDFVKMGFTVNQQNQ